MSLEPSVFAIEAVLQDCRDQEPDQHERAERDDTERRRESSRPDAAEPTAPMAVDARGSSRQV